MKTSLSHLPTHKQAELKAIIGALIPRWVEIEMIILFSNYAQGISKEWVQVLRSLTESICRAKIASFTK